MTMDSVHQFSFRPNTPLTATLYTCIDGCFVMFIEIKNAAATLEVSFISVIMLFIMVIIFH